MRWSAFGFSNKTMLPYECVKYILFNLDKLNYEEMLFLYEALKEGRASGVRFLGEVEHEDCKGDGGTDYDNSYKVYDFVGYIFGIAKIKSERKMMDDFGYMNICDEIRIVDIVEKEVKKTVYEVVKETEEQENE